MRVRAPLTIRQLTVAVGALAEGCSLRQHVDPQLEGIVLPTGVNGENQEWTLFGIGLEALLLHFFEPDPDWSGEGIPSPVGACRVDRPPLGPPLTAGRCAGRWSAGRPLAVAAGPLVDQDRCQCGDGE